jgi:redox-sensitive bicupin YhaK (pirin superfamily)
MEILSYVLEGALAHRDDNGGGGVIHAGELQWMGAGHGIEHSEYNGSDSEPVHFLQIWIQPDRLNAQPAYAQRMATGDDAPGQWQLLVSPDGASGSIAIRQNMRLFLARLQAGATIERELDPQRHYWLQVTRGAVQSKDRSLAAGDAMGLTEEGGTLELATTQPSEILLFDLP